MCGLEREPMFAAIQSWFFFVLIEVNSKSKHRVAAAAAVETSQYTNLQVPLPILPAIFIHGQRANKRLSGVGGHWLAVILSARCVKRLMP